MSDPVTTALQSVWKKLGFSPNGPSVSIQVPYHGAEAVQCAVRAVIAVTPPGEPTSTSGTFPTLPSSPSSRKGKGQARKVAEGEKERGQAGEGDVAVGNTEMKGIAEASSRAGSWVKAKSVEADAPGT